MKNNYGIKVSTCDGINLKLENCSIKNNLNGIALNVINNGNILVKGCSISENIDNGVSSINNSINTKMYFLSNSISRNGSYGCLLSNISPSTNYNYMTKETQQSYPVFNLNSCDISNNKIGGISLKNIYLNIELCKILDNCNWSIEVPLECNKNLIKLINYENQLNAMINNPIGGAWGIIANKKSICSNDKCNLL
jgi:hypothetical protein